MSELTRTSLVVNPNQTTPSLQCPICLDLVIEPYECEECCKIFCKECITNWLNNSPTDECPNKHQFKKKKILDDWVTESLKKIFIKCPYKTCYSQYSMSLWANHLKVCNGRTQGLKDETPTGEEIFADKEIQFFVKDLQGHSYLFKMPVSTTVIELKEKIKDKTGIRVEDQRLIGNAKNMDDHKTLEYYFIQEGSNIQLVMRLKGGLIMKYYI